MCASVNLLLSLHNWMALVRLGCLSPNGRCKTFDRAADGFGRAEACISIVIQDGSVETPHHSLLPHIVGSAINQDGASASFMAPNGMI